MSENPADQLSAFFATHHEGLARVVGRRVNQPADHPDVQDATAAAWERAIRYGAPLDSEEALFGWMVVTATRRWLTAHGKASREAPGVEVDTVEDLTDAAGSVSAEDEAINRETLRQVRGLNPAQAFAVLAIASGYSREEIAAMLGRTVRATDRALMKGRTLLRDDQD